MWPSRLMVVAAKLEKGDQMKNEEGRAGRSFHGSLDDAQHAVSRQLMQVVVSTQHMDELLYWLARSFVQLFNIQVVQFWAVQAWQNGQQSLELRNMSCQEATLPSYVITNSHVVELVRGVLLKQQVQSFQSVEMLFSSYQANLLKRCELNYCTAYFLSNNLMLPPFNRDNIAGRVPTSLMMAMLLFFQSIPSARLLPTIDTLLKQAILAAGKRGLLLEGSAQNSMRRRQFSQPPDLYRLVPHHVPNREAMRSSNPFTNTEPLPDKDALRLYRTIDGQRTIGELAAATQLQEKFIYKALQTLLSRQSIQLVDTKGVIVDHRLLFPDRSDQIDDT